MKGLIITNDDSRLRIFTAWLSKISDRINIACTFEHLQEQDFFVQGTANWIDDLKILEVLNDSEYQWVSFPLSMPFYLSIRFAELAHSTRTQTKLILCSGTEAPRDILLQLFDGYIPYPLPIVSEFEAEFQRVLGSPAMRYDSQARIDEAVLVVLSCSNCFESLKRHGGRHGRHGGMSMLETYKCRNHIRANEEMYSNVIDYSDYSRNKTKNRFLTKILFLSSDPSDYSRLRVQQEMRDIQDAIRKSNHREMFSFTTRTSVRAPDISQAILDVEPDIIHFSGHGSDTGEICVEDENGMSIPLETEALASLFNLLNNKSLCVILSSCFSVEQASILSKHIKYVIGMEKEIGDEAAIAFAIGFYKALATGRPISDAFKFGIVEMKLLGLREGSTPMILTR